MKRNYKKAVSVLVLGAMLMGSTNGLVGAFADGGSAQPILAAPAPADSVNMPSAYIFNDKKVIFNRLVMPFPGSQGEVFLPVKKVAESLGYSVAWNGKTSSVTLKYGGKSVTFKLIKDAKSSTGYSIKDGNGRVYIAKIQLGSLYTVADAFVEGMGAVAIYDQDNALRMDAKRFAPDEASTLGLIDQVTQGKDGVQILVKGQVFGQYGYETISLAVSMKTAVTLSNGTAVKVSDLKAGDYIYVKYNKAVTKSIPAMSQAETLVVLKDESFLKGKVYFKQASIEKHSIAPPIYQLRVSGTNDFILTLDQNVVITDAKGNAKTFEDIKMGGVVSVYTAAYAAMSYPGQTTAFRIVIE